MLSSPGQFAFTAIPQTYRHLLLRTIIRGAAAGSGGLDGLNARFNDVASIAYNTQRWYAYQTTSAAAELINSTAALFADIPDSTSASLWGIAEIIIPNYRLAAGGFITWRSFGSAAAPGGAGRVFNNGGLWHTGAAAITKLALFAQLGAGLNFAAGSRASLYGIK